MTIELSVEEIQFVRNAVKFAATVSENMIRDGHPASADARKALAVSKGVLDKLAAPNPQSN
jgi:hypothetical protein